MIFDDAQLISFTKPISDTEEQKCERAIQIVINALKLGGYSIDATALQAPAYTAKAQKGGTSLSLFLQGSYANNTNIKLDSDVDVAVVLDSQFGVKYRPGASDSDYKFTNAAYIDIKGDICTVLKQCINGSVIRKNKSIRITENSYRAAIDVVPCIEFRDYSNEFYNDPTRYIPGIKIKADDGSTIINYPKVHLENGRKKNEETNHYYKKVVRILKNIRNLMEESGQSIFAQYVSSFQLESLLWNVSNQCFLQYNDLYALKFSNIVSILAREKGNFANCKEVNGVKPLFSSPQMLQTYQNFIDELYDFYHWR